MKYYKPSAIIKKTRSVNDVNILYDDVFFDINLFSKEDFDFAPSRHRMAIRMFFRNLSEEQTLRISELIHKEDVKQISTEFKEQYNQLPDRLKYPVFGTCCLHSPTESGKSTIKKMINELLYRISGSHFKIDTVYMDMMVDRYCAILSELYYRLIAEEVTGQDYLENGSFWGIEKSLDWSKINSVSELLIIDIVAYFDFTTKAKTEHEEQLHLYLIHCFKELNSFHNKKMAA